MVASSNTLVLITGANQGIGFETARKLGTEHKDYHIIVSGRRENAIKEAVSKLQELGVSAEPLVMDQASDESIAAAVKEVDARHGRLDVLINNAAVNMGTPTRETWQTLYNINVFGVAMVTDAFIPLLEKSDKVKRIVNVTSGLGSCALTKIEPNCIYGSKMPEFIIYSSSKAALNLMTVHYAARFEEKGWKINLACPGYCATNLNNYGGTNDPATGAINPCRLATLGEDGETGTFSHKDGPYPW